MSDIKYKYIFQNLEAISKNIIDEEREKWKDAVKYHLSDPTGHGVNKGKLAACRKMVNQTDDELRKSTVEDVLNVLQWNVTLKPVSETINRLELIVSPIIELFGEEKYFKGISVAPRYNQIYIQEATTCGRREPIIKIASNQFIKITLKDYDCEIYYDPHALVCPE